MAESALNALVRLSRAYDKQARARVPSALSLKVDAQDVQGIVLRGYGGLPAASYLLLAVSDPVKARATLGALHARIARGTPASRESALQLAFTHPGLVSLGLSEEARSGFSREFSTGMVTPHRSRFLGDVGDSAPERWQWGGPATPTVHALAIVLADSQTRLDATLTALQKELSSGGFRELRTLPASQLFGYEHFGFVDGISQPAIDGYHEGSSELHRIRPGEFLLGYPNEYDLYTERPLLEPSSDLSGHLPLDPEGSPRHDLGRNGTYLVFRQLRQDVPLFRAKLSELTRKPDGSVDLAARERLAARMVGRWPSGAPLIEAPYSDEPSKAQNNEFRYQREDPAGLKCPIGAHVRRANPRDALAPSPGTRDSLAVNRRHRLLRRGRTYGPPLAEAETDKLDRGLHFIALNANIIRQFEFIQHSWLVDPRFNGMSGQADPLLSALPDNQFVVQGDPVSTRCTGLPRFVNVVGGAYFFLPGLRALRFLSESKP
jgi:Dyp-type peroxidase family